MYVDFFCSVFPIVSPATSTSTTPPVTFMCSRTSPTSMSVTIAAISVVLVALGEHEVVLPPHLILRDTVKGICQLWHGSSSGEFSLSEECPPLTHYVV